MTSRVEALNHLVDVLAGTDIPRVSGNVAKNIDDLATAIENGEISIGGGGGGNFVVTVTQDSQAGAESYKSDKTFDEIAAAQDGGKVPVCRVVTGGGDYEYYYLQSGNGQIGGYSFIRHEISSTSIAICEVAINFSNVVTLTTTNYTG